MQTPSHGSSRTIAFASIIWAGSIFPSRVIGFLREQIIRRTLGASRQAGLYFASFTLPDFLNYLLAAGALSIVFIPIFVEYIERDDLDGAWRALSVIANFILVVGGLAITILIVFARFCRTRIHFSSDRCLLFLSFGELHITRTRILSIKRFGTSLRISTSRVGRAPDPRAAREPSTPKKF